jgi:ATP adenylyltransferase
VGGEREPGCVFCRARDEAADPERLVVAEGAACFVLLNRYPYTTGHLMAVPRRHVGGMEDLSAAEIAELWGFLVEAKAALTRLYRPDGFNVGINVGSVAGAGIVDHLHVHLVPRWAGDTNFMPVFADVRVIPQHIEEVRLSLLRELSGSSRT